MEEMHQRKVEKIIESAEGSAGLLQNHEANDLERRNADPEEGRRRREVARSL